MVSGLDDENVLHPWVRNPGPRPHDCPLTDHGRDQAAAVGRRLASERLPCTVVYSSPIRRCLESAAEIAHQLGLPVAVIVALGKSSSYYRASASEGRTPIYANASEAADILRSIHPSVSLQEYIEDDGWSCLGTIQRLLAKSVEESAVKHSVTLVVGHSETQKLIAWQSGRRKPLHTPYCGKANFLLRHVQKSGESGGFWYIVQRCKHQRKIAPGQPRALNSRIKTSGGASVF